MQFCDIKSDFHIQDHASASHNCILIAQLCRLGLDSTLFSHKTLHVYRSFPLLSHCCIRINAVESRLRKGYLLAMFTIHLLSLQSLRRGNVSDSKAFGTDLILKINICCFVGRLSK